jgi:hypothetical protein
LYFFAPPGPFAYHHASTPLLRRRVDAAVVALATQLVNKSVLCTLVFWR